MAETILQHWIFSQFILPFFLVFFIVFGILEKSKMFGDSKKQLNALVAFIVGLIFVGAIFPKLVVSNLILFLTVAIVVVFVGLLLWAFVSGEDAKIPDKLKVPAGILVLIAVLGGVLWALGTSIAFFQDAFDFVFKSGWSKDFWTNFTFLAVVIIALVAMIKPSKP